MKNINDCEISSIIFELPLYQKINIELTDLIEVKHENFDPRDMSGDTYITYLPKQLSRLIEFVRGGIFVHGLCPNCMKETAFQIEKTELDAKITDESVLCYCDAEIDNEHNIPSAFDCLIERISLLVRNHEYFDKYFKCPLCEKKYRAAYHIFYEFSDGDNVAMYLVKIGQYPSVSSFGKYNTNAYQKLLKKIGALEDMRNATHMHTDGYDIAALTYLRRVFEKFIFHKFSQFADEIGISQSEYRKLHLDKKLDVLKNKLPPFIFENTEIYSVVSAGIHMLEEDECKEYFTVIKSAIEVIMSQEEAERNRVNFEK